MSQYFSEVIQNLRSKLKKESAHKTWVILLDGPLGAGKTTFVKEWLTQEGCTDQEVQSPTFLKLLEYRLPNRTLVVHMDCYRMDESVELTRLSLESYVDKAKIFFVEWPELFNEYFNEHPHLRKMLEPVVYVNIKITPQADGSRYVHTSGAGVR